MGSECSFILNCFLGPVVVKSMKFSSMIFVIILASYSELEWPLVIRRVPSFSQLLNVLEK